MCTVESGSADIANINPYRYRGYYYDAEIGMYYLQSRYYDPAVGRFINADDIRYSVAIRKPLDDNLFVYCENDCVNGKDVSGFIAARIVSAIVSALLSALTDIVCQVFIEYLNLKKKTKKTPSISRCMKKINWITVLISAVGGALTGLLIASRFKTYAVALGSGIIASITGIINGIISGFNVLTILLYAIIDFGVALLLAVISKGSFAYKYYQKISLYFYVKGANLIRMCKPVFKEFMKALAYTCINNFINLFTGVVRSVA